MRCNWLIIRTLHFNFFVGSNAKIPPLNVSMATVPRFSWCSPRAQGIKYVTWFIVSATWPFHKWNMTHPVWCDSFFDAPFRCKISDMWRGSFIRVTWLIYRWNVTHSQGRHDSCIRVTWFFSWYVQHDLFTCNMILFPYVYMCSMMHFLYVWHNSVSICGIWFFLRRSPWTQGMGWLRLVGSLKLQVSIAEYRLFYKALL